VFFDTAPILYDVARADDLTPDQLTAITCAFCDRIRANGYEPMIYANSKRFTTVLHLEKLEAYDKWLADYRNKPDYPYAFKMWQFTEKGSVPGIDGNVDIDLYFYEE
jgi:GH25 family lysozyme M1 (1,4-beta-N-acetylmuramidase)